MAVNPNVIQTSDPAQMFLAAQKQNQDLVKNVMETMRLQQEVDDRKKQNQWTNTWDVLQKQAENTVGGMAGLIGQNQGLIEQLFQANGMNKWQSKSAVSNLAKTLLTSDAQAQIRLAKYQMDPYAMLTEKVEEAPPQPAPTPDTIKGGGGEQKTETPLVPANPQPAPAPTGAKGDPYAGFRYSFQTFLQDPTKTAPSGDLSNLGKASETYRGSVADYNYGVTSKASKDMFGLEPFDKEILFKAVTDSGLYRIDPAHPDLAENQLLQDLRLVYLKNQGDPAAKKKFDEYMTGKVSGVVDEKIKQRLTFAQSFLDRSGMSQVTGQDTPIEAMRQWALDDTGKSMQNPGTPGQPATRVQGTSGFDYRVKPNESFVQYADRWATASNKSTSSVFKKRTDESDTAFQTRVLETMKKGNDSLYRNYMKQTAATSAVSANTDTSTNPSTAAEQANMGATLVSDQAKWLASQKPNTPQGQAAAELINKKGAEVEMTIRELDAALANNTQSHDEKGNVYINYLDEKSKSAGDWLSAFAPITEDYLTKVYGRTSVAEAYQDLLAHGSGGSTALQNKRNMELQVKAMENTMAQFAANFGLDKDKFDWQKNVDIASVVLKQRELALRGATADTPEKEYLKRQLDVIDRYEKLVKETDPKLRKNALIALYHKGGEYKQAWDYYTMWSASELGLGPKDIGELSFEKGWFGSLLQGIFGGNVLTMPTVSPPVAGTPGEEAAAPTGSTAADDVARRQGF